MTVSQFFTIQTQSIRNDGNLMRTITARGNRRLPKYKLPKKKKKQMLNPICIKFNFFIKKIYRRFIFSGVVGVIVFFFFLTVPSIFSSGHDPPLTSFRYAIVADRVGHSAKILRKYYVEKRIDRRKKPETTL